MCIRDRTGPSGRLRGNNIIEMGFRGPFVCLEIYVVHVPPSPCHTERIIGFARAEPNACHQSAITRHKYEQFHIDPIGAAEPLYLVVLPPKTPPPPYIHRV